MLVLKLADQTVSSSSVSIETRAQTDSGLHSTNVSALPACSVLDSLPRLQKLSDACHDKVQWKCFIKCIKWKITEEKLAQYVLFTCQCLFFLKSSSNGLKKKKSILNTYFIPKYWILMFVLVPTQTLLPPKSRQWALSNLCEHWVCAFPVI